MYTFEVLFGGLRFTKLYYCTTQVSCLLLYNVVLYVYMTRRIPVNGT